MTAPAPQRLPGRLTGPALGMLLALAVLLVPVGYLAVKVWSVNTESTRVVATERAAVAFGRPLVKLMAMLVEARTTAVEKITVDDSGIQAAVKEINMLDRGAAERLGTDQRWNELANEINNTLARNASGSDALRTYGTPIALTQELLESIVDSSQAVQDPAGTFHLLEVAMHQLPKAIGVAGELAANAASGDNKQASQIQLFVGEERIGQLADEVSITLRDATGHHVASQFATDLRILKPLDTFSASASELTVAAGELAMTNATGVVRLQMKDRIDTASGTLRTAAVELANALFDAFDGQMGAAASGHAKQRWFLIVIEVVIVLAVAALMWLRFPWPERRRSPEAEIDTTGRHGIQVIADPRPETNLVDARDLLTRESADLGRAVGARKR